MGALFGTVGCGPATNHSRNADSFLLPGSASATADTNAQSSDDSGEPTPQSVMSGSWQTLRGRVFTISGSDAKLSVAANGVNGSGSLDGDKTTIEWGGNVFNGTLRSAYSANPAISNQRNMIVWGSNKKVTGVWILSSALSARPPTLSAQWRNEGGSGVRITQATNHLTFSSRGGIYLGFIVDARTIIGLFGPTLLVGNLNSKIAWRDTNNTANDTWAPSAPR